jgi:hypothetical protein
MSQNRGHQRAYLSSPGWHVSVEGHGDDDDDGKNSWLFHHSSMGTEPAEASSSKEGEWTKKWELLSVSEIPQRMFNMLQNLTTWDLRLYFPSEGRCAADFYRP